MDLARNFSLQVVIVIKYGEGLSELAFHLRYHELDSTNRGILQPPKKHWREYTVYCNAISVLLRPAYVLISCASHR
jgi:hypothetical protein